MLYDYIQVLAAFIMTVMVVVFVHEFGHYIVAKLSGVRVTDFSLGFGPKICSWKDGSGTEWKICAIPLGGYVKFLGDKDPSSSGTVSIKKSDEKHSFYHQGILTRASVVVAGPVANFLLGIVVFAFFFARYGTFVLTPDINGVAKDSPAYIADLKVGDKIVGIDGRKVKDVQDVAGYISIHPGQKIEFSIERDGQVISKDITLDSYEIKDKLGIANKVGKLGVTFIPPQHKKLSIIESIGQSCREVYRMSELTLKAIGQMVTGKRDTKDLGGPIKIARYAGASMKEGMASMVYFVSLISINLGLVNLLPIPMLDGGHLFFYIIESVFGRDKADFVQRHMVKFGFIILLGLMLIAIINDIVYF